MNMVIFHTEKDLGKTVILKLLERLEIATTFGEFIMAM